MKLVACTACTRLIHPGDRCPHCGATAKLSLAAGVLSLSMLAAACATDQPAYGVADSFEGSTGDFGESDTDTETSTSGTTTGGQEGSTSSSSGDDSSSTSGDSTSTSTSSGGSSSSGTDGGGGSSSSTSG